MSDTDQTAALKQRVEDEWGSEETGQAWHKYYPQLKEQLKGVTKSLVDAADPVPGMAVLDLASGTGEPSLSLAHRVSPGGKVIATDLSEAMLRGLRANAAEENLTNIETRLVDAHSLPFEDNAFDLVTSRYGVMFFVEVQKALAEIRRVLKPGGRVAFLAWGAPAPGTYFGATVLPYMKRLGRTPDPDAPGPMRYASPGKLKAVVEEAGFTDVSERIYDMDAPWRGNPESMITALMELAAPFRLAAMSLPEADQNEARAEALANLGEKFDGEVISLVAPSVLVVGTK